MRSSLLFILVSLAACGDNLGAPDGGSGGDGGRTDAAGTIPTVVSNLPAGNALDIAINAMASSAVADLYWPLRRRAGHAVDLTSSKAPRLAVALMGALLIGFAVMLALIYDPGGKRPLLDFALGVMAFAYSGMLGVFLTALLTRRGNTRSVLAALVIGVTVVTVLQDPILSRLTMTLMGEPRTLASFWVLPIATVVSTVVCMTGAPAPSSRQAIAVESAGSMG